MSKEYGTVALVLSGILAMLIWKDLIRFDHSQPRGEIQIMLLMFIPIIIFYGTARYLKKTGRLQKKRPDSNLKSRASDS